MSVSFYCIIPSGVSCSFMDILYTPDLSPCNIVHTAHPWTSPVYTLTCLLYCFVYTPTYNISVLKTTSTSVSRGPRSTPRTTRCTWVRAASKSSATSPSVAPSSSAIPTTVTSPPGRRYIHNVNDTSLVEIKSKSDINIKSPGAQLLPLKRYFFIKSYF